MNIFEIDPTGLDLSLNGKEEKKEEYNPYCELCDCCGEDGCCSHLGCFRTLVENNKMCKYGKTYLNDAKYKVISLDNVCKFIDTLELTDQQKELFEKCFDDAYDLVYNKE